MAWVNSSNSGQIFAMGVHEMTKNRWKKTILSQMSALNLQNDAYGPAVETLASILEQRDKTAKEFRESGGLSVIRYTNKGGSTNTAKNPLLIMWDDLNKSALAYWRELGLTPSSYKKTTGGPPADEKSAGLAEVLKSLEAGQG